MHYIFDTNILVSYVRDTPLAKHINKAYQPFDARNKAIISVVTLAEIRSLAMCRGWGAQRMAVLDRLLAQFLWLDIKVERIIDRYVQIDAYSQGKHQKYPVEFSARNMGKNDLWIAATASVINAKLLTTDKDFDHLSPTWLELQRFDPKATYK